MKRCLLACLVLPLLAIAASAASLTQDVRFSYSRPSVGTSVLESGPADGFPHPYYKVVSPGSGTFSASHNSKLIIDYEPLLASPGNLTIDLRLSPVNASFREVFGTSATVGLGKNPFDNSQPLVSAGVGLSVDVQASGIGAIGTSLSASDVGVAQPAPGLGIPFVLEATASPSITATNRMDFGRFAGTLFFRNRDTGLTVSRQLSLTHAGFNRLSVDLPERGIYDVSVNSPFLGAGLTSTRSFGVSFNVEVFGGGLINPPPTINLAPPTNIIGSVPFQLNSADRNALQNWFTIEVVPEPSAWALCCAALPAAWVLARRRRRPRAGQ